MDEKQKLYNKSKRIERTILHYRVTVDNSA